MKRLVTLLMLAALLVVTSSSAGTSQPKGSTMNETEAISQAMQDHGLVRKTPNTAEAPPAAGAPDFVYEPAPALGLALEYVRGHVRFSDGSTTIGELPAGAIPILVTVLNTESWQTDDPGFDYTTTLDVTLTPNNEGGAPITLGTSPDISGYDPNTPITLESPTTASFSDATSSVSATVEPQNGSSINGGLDVVVAYAR